jgi:1-acyl-sn-glycerol-3-phosphate acyltransferase
VARSAGYEKGNGWILVCQGVFYPLTRMLGRRRFVGNQQLAAPGAALVVANHISHIDPVYDTVFIRKSGRWPHVLAKSSLWKIPVVRSALRGTQQIPVERGGGAGGTALDAATEALRDGKVVLIYPEGTVSREPDHWPMRPRPGVAMLALSGDFPVIPVVHWGTQAVYTSYRAGWKVRPFPRRDVSVVAGPPIDLSRWRGKPVDARAIRDVSYLIMNTIKEMMAELRGEPAPDGLFDPKRAAQQGSGSSKPPAGSSGAPAQTPPDPEASRE